MNGNLLNRVPALFSFVILLTCFGVKSVHAQSITSSGSQTQINLNANQIDISGGTRSGGNLFHSFGQFGLNAGQVANFQSNPNIQNILGRVTGGNASIINGTLQVTGGPSNLFLLNPAGIIFGQNAQLNVPASFTASTANGIGFGNNQWFNATGSDNYATLSGTPSTADFLAGSGGNILNAGSLSVAQGQSLTLLGGTVINTGTLTSPGGTITIAAVPGGRSVRLTDSNSLLSIELPLSPNATLNATTFTPQTLPALLTGGNLASATGITVNNGVVTLTGSSTPVSTTVGSLTLAGRLNADAGTVGNGGTIRANAEKTLVTGRLSSEGGSTSGNGGFIETSGKSLTIAPSTTVSTRAPNGQQGTWLLDPANLTVNSSGAVDTIAPATIENNLNSGNVTLQATDSITVSEAINAINNIRDSDLILIAPITNLNASITLKPNSILSGTAGIVNVGTAGTVQNGVDAAAAGGTVILSAATYNLDKEVSISKNLTVRGVSANQTTVSGSNAVRVFKVETGTITLDLISIKNGKTADNGGGILNNGATLTVKNSTISNNISLDLGGGIFSVFGSTSVIDNSTLSGNSAVLGGGVFNGGILNAENSTISSNTATYGGGIFNVYGLSLNNSTVVYNTSTATGGGIYNQREVTIGNSVVAGNMGATGSEEVSNAAGNTILFTSQGNNLVGQNGSAGGFQTIASDILVPGAIGAQIGTLANNGGTTLTHAVLPGSLAIDAANPATATTTGQTGNAIAGTARDIGAYEFGGFQFNLTTISGTPQSAVVGKVFQPLVVEVRPNITGQQVAGGSVNVAFTPNTGISGAGIANTAAQTVTIGANNRASITPTANTVTGTHTVVANAAGNTGTAQTFNLTNTPDVAATLASTGSGQAAVVNTDFAAPLQLVVRDQYGNVIPGAIVAFSSPANTGATGLLNGTPNTAVNGTTDLNGVITIAVKANRVAGNYNTTATTGGLSSTFALTNNPDVAALVTATGGGTQSTPVATGFTNALQTRVTDQYGNPISGATVDFTVPGGSTTVAGGTPSGTTALTDANGFATVTITANTKAGTFVATSRVNGVTPIAQYNLTNVAASPATVTATGGSIQSTTVATPFGSALQATVVDIYGNPVQGAIVNFTFPGSRANATSSRLTATTDANGLASITVNANTIAGTYSVTGGTNALTPAQYRLTNLAGAATTVTASGSGQTAVVNTGFTNPLQATVTDIYGNPISGATVNFTVPATGASGTVATAIATTNANGVATTTVTANGTVGAYAATGAVTGLTASYNLTNTANPASIPATIAIVNGSGQSTTVNTAFTTPLQVVVKNNTGTPLANTSVTFTLPGAIGTSASTLTVSTDANGIASLPVTALGTSGTFSPIATVNNLTTQFTLTNNPVAVIPVNPINPVTPVIPVNPINPVTPVNPVSPGNRGILTSVEQVRIGQNLQRSNPNAKTPAVTSGGSSSLCIVRDRETQNKKTIFDRQEDNQKTAESQKLPDCKPTEKATSITK